MTHQLTILTPIAPAHEPLFPIAQASVAQQTIKCAHLWMVDTDGRGPGFIRNRLLERVTTPFVSFLDCDDWLEPRFAELTLQRMSTIVDKYVYTDWFVDGKHIEAPNCAWTRGTYHLVTAVYPTEWVRAVGGFDEQMRGLEDTEFAVKLTTSGYTCCRLPIPLVHYRANGGRAAAVYQNQQLFNELQALIHQRYGGKQVSCCGDVMPTNNTPINERQEGDILAVALWGGNREEFGRATGRRYPRTGNGKLLYMDKRDALASPHLWQVMPEVRHDPSIPPPEPEPTPLPAVIVEPPPAKKGLAALEQVLINAGIVQVPQTLTMEVTSQSQNDAGVKRARLPNVNKVKRLASVAYGDTSWPIFVMPRQQYASYSDLWELARLSGFELIYQDEADLSDARQTFIFAAPEYIPDCTHAKARTILWQLEYAGDYTKQEHGDTVSEVWSSDPAHAERTGATYVMLGSHPGLNPELARAGEIAYDVTMLAYMVGRRGEIKERLKDYRWPKNYPGHTGLERHRLLQQTRLMLHVHQHEEGALTPLRLAVAAAYRMPVISERVPDAGLYKGAVMWADYDGLVSRTHQFLGGHVEQDAHYDDALFTLLCIEHRFDTCVFEGLKS